MQIELKSSGKGNPSLGQSVLRLFSKINPWTALANGQTITNHPPCRVAILRAMNIALVTLWFLRTGYDLHFAASSSTWRGGVKGGRAHAGANRVVQDHSHLGAVPGNASCN